VAAPPRHQEASEDAHVQTRAGPDLLCIRAEGGTMLIGLVGEPLLKLVGLGPRASGRIERRCAPY
jgi:hypothetical protein